MADHIDALERLGRLRSEGMLSEEEFAREKAALLSASAAGPPPVSLKPRWKLIGGILIATVVLIALVIAVLLVVPAPKRAVDSEASPTPSASTALPRPAPTAAPTSLPSLPDRPQSSPVADADDAPSKPGRCKLEVRGTSYIDGPCTIALEKDGTFTIADRKNDRGYFAMVQRDGAEAAGYWNGAPDSEHAQDELGPLKRNGACWENATGRICAWGK